VIKEAFRSGNKQGLPPLHVLIYSFQLCRGLAHLHGMGISHRDLKPQNILIDTRRNILKICDFGSAKALEDDEPNIAYICTRHYRAPELIVGDEGQICYTSAVDVWSAGCVIAEMLIGQALFPGISKYDQMIEITKVLGLPTEEEMRALSPVNPNFRFPLVGSDTMQTVFQKANLNATDFLKKMLTYAPERRIRMIDACADHFFVHLRTQIKELLADETISLGMCIFTKQEISNASRETKQVLREFVDSVRPK
jgi:glycogen synthase kinase 3 beta